MKLFGKDALFAGKVIFFFVVLFAVYYFTSVMDVVDSMNPVVQFVFVQGAFYGLLYFFLHHIGGGVKTKAARISYGVVLFIMAIDLITPEYHVTQAGTLIGGGVLGKGSIDYLFGYLGQSLGITGSFTISHTTIGYLALFTYPVCAALLVIAAVIIEPRLQQKTT